MESKTRKLSITFGVFIFLPLIATAKHAPVSYIAEFVDSYKAAEEIPDLYKLISGVPDYCENNSLTLNFSSSLTLERDSIKAPTITCVSVENIELNMASGAFENLPNLKHLGLRGNNLKFDNLFAFGPLPNVKELLIEDQNRNYYEQDTRVNDVYPELEYLSLRNTGFSSFSSTERNPFPKLKYLNLADNGRERIFMTAIPNTLTHLDLHNNLITSYTPQFSNLLSLLLDNNNIQSIGVNGLDLRALKQLEILSITNNKISSIYSGAFESLANLRYLNLSGNRLSSSNLMSELDYLKLLEILILDRNSFEEVPRMNTLNVTILSLKCNNITHLTVNSFVNVTMLRELDLSNNQISFINPDVFVNQNILEVLNLSNNQIYDLSTKWLVPLKSLRYLNVSRNRILLESLSHASLPSNLRELYFEGNNLTYLNKSILQMIPDNLTIYLNVGSQSNLCPSSKHVDPYGIERYYG